MWACVGGAMLVAITAVLVPWPAAESFLLSMLPKLSHGDQFFEGIDPVNRLRLAAVNFSVFGLVMKLREFGASIPPAVADAMTWIFSVILAVLVWMAASRRASKLRLIQVGLAALILASTRSPFVPSAYGALWLIILIAVDGESWRRWFVAIVSLVCLSYVVPDRHAGFPSPPARLAIGLIQQLSVFALALSVLWREWRRTDHEKFAVPAT